MLDNLVGFGDIGVVGFQRKLNLHVGPASDPCAAQATMATTAVAHARAEIKVGKGGVRGGAQIGDIQWLIWIVANTIV
ncbi:hypothetical protein [Synechococcus sp. CCY 0621]|uniref:hypothetical protein n=1 Tax=Synechococcus sp. CCY 0621 TaxID=2815603 RepID=UPI001C2395DA|nr:hypothetical protein [Synechococcus sp. CCY 0621]